MDEGMVDEGTGAGAREVLGWSQPLWIGVLVLVLLSTLGGHALIDPDEGRNAAIALEMAASGDWIVPTLNQLPFLDKPFLYFLATAASLKALGNSDFAVRLPALLFTLATGWLIVWFALPLLGRRAAWVAGFATISAPLAIAFSSTVIFDSMLAFFIVLAILAFHRAVDTRLASPRTHALTWTLLAWSAMALGVLVKGPVALVLPLLVMTPFALWRRASIAVWHPAGWLLHFAIVIPWLLMVEHEVPGFVHYALVTESLNRLTTDELDRNGPVWYFLPYFLGGMLPWSLIALGGATRGFITKAWREDRQRLVFLLLWIALPLIFFSLSQSKRPQYILPTLPALALLSAWVWTDRDAFRKGVRWAAGAWVLFGALFIVVALQISLGSGQLVKELEPELLSAARWTVWIFGLSALSAGVVSWLAARRRNLAWLAVSMPLLVLPLAAQPVLYEVAAQRSAKELATALAPHLTPHTQIIGIETFSPSLNFYLQRPSIVASATGRPLRSNYLTRAYPSLIAAEVQTLRSAGAWERAIETCAGPTVFLLRPRYRAEQARLRADGANVLFENRKLVAMHLPCAGGPRQVAEAGRSIQPVVELSLPTDPLTVISEEGQ